MFDHLAQLFQVEEGDAGIHVVFDVVVHLPMQVPHERVNLDRTAVDPEIRNVGRKTGVLWNGDEPGEEASVAGLTASTALMTAGISIADSVLFA